MQFEKNITPIEYRLTLLHIQKESQIEALIQSQGFRQDAMSLFFCYQQFRVFGKEQITNIIQSSKRMGPEIFPMVLDWVYIVLRNLFKFMLKEGLQMKCLPIICVLKKFTHFYKQFVALADTYKLGLTALHTLFLQCCLQSKAYKIADTFIKGQKQTTLFFQPFDIEANDTNPSKYCQMYFYYCAVVYSGLQQYENVQQYLEICLKIHTVQFSLTLKEAKKLQLLTYLRLKGSSKEKANTKQNSFNNHHEYAFQNCLKPFYDLYQSNSLLEYEDVLNRNKDYFNDEETYVKDYYNIFVLQQLLEEMKLAPIIASLKKVKKFQSKMLIADIKVELKVESDDATIQKLLDINRFTQDFLIDKKNMILIFQSQKTNNRIKVLKNLGQYFELVCEMKPKFTDIGFQLAKRS